jgi:hypothetical protein
VEALLWYAAGGWSLPDGKGGGRWKRTPATPCSSQPSGGGMSHTLPGSASSTALLLVMPAQPTCSPCGPPAPTPAHRSSCLNQWRAYQLCIRVGHQAGRGISDGLECPWWENTHIAAASAGLTEGRLIFCGRGVVYVLQLLLNQYAPRSSRYCAAVISPCSEC